MLPQSIMIGWAIHMTSNNSRPLIPVNPQGLDEIARALLENKTDDVSGDDAITSSAPKGLFPSIILPGNSTYGTQSYPDLYVGIHRIGYQPSMQAIGKFLGVALQNTATERNGAAYIGNINWEEAIKLNLKLGNMTATPRQHDDFRELLQAGLTGKKKVYDQDGKQIDSNRLSEIYNEIAEVRDSWRSEWLGARFVEKNGLLHVEYNHKLQGNTLIASKSEALEDRVGEESWVDVTSFNRQGLPTKKSSKHDLYHWPPADGRVAWFVADSGGAVLDCSRVPTGRNAELGVRPVRAKK